MSEKKCPLCNRPMVAKVWKHQWVCTRCGKTKPFEEKPTNADYIRNMTDEELVPLIRAFITTEECPQEGRSCGKCFFDTLCIYGRKRWLSYELEWLQRPAEEDT